MASPSHLYATILAGGSGQRFWPLSRELNPKQLLSMFGTESLIAAAVHRILPFAEGGSSVVVATNERLFDELRNHLTAQPDPELHAVRYIQEPLPKNTAPAIALAAATFVAEDPDAIMVVLPSDHLLEDGEVWARLHQRGRRVSRPTAISSPSASRPRRAETGYGYIRAAEALPQFTRGLGGSARRRRVRREARRRARRGVRRERRVLLERRHLRDEGGAGARGARPRRRRRGTDRRRGALDRRAAAGGSQRRRGARAVRGARVALDRHGGHGAQRPGRGHSRARSSGATSARCWPSRTSPSPTRAATCASGRGVDIDSHQHHRLLGRPSRGHLGVEDLIVVDTTDATLVLPKDRAQDVRQVVDALKAHRRARGHAAQGQPAAVGHRGQSLLESPSYQIKLIEVKPGCRLSLQKHHHRSEHWIVVSGHGDGHPR